MFLLLLIVSLFNIQPCVHEDGSTQRVCYWDASSRGNGVGDSYIMLDGNPIYLR